MVAKNGVIDAETTEKLGVEDGIDFGTLTRVDLKIFFGFVE